MFSTRCLPETEFGSMTPTSQWPLALSVASVHTSTFAENKTEIIDVSDKLIEWKLCLLVSQVMHVWLIFQELTGRDHVILFSIRMIHLQILKANSTVDAVNSCARESLTHNLEYASFSVYQKSTVFLIL